jgi:parvulin-like peptidyl-prolyl isomerase
MKKTFLAIAIALAAATLTAGQLVESIVIRVGDRIITRSQYELRLRQAYNEVEQTAAPNEVAAKKEEVRKNMTQELVNELLIKDRADRLGLSVTPEELKDAIGKLKDQYGIKTDQQFDESLQKSGMTRSEMETRMRDTLLTNKVFGAELHSREEATDAELRERYDREKERFRLPERARLREIVIVRPTDPAQNEKAAKRAEQIAAQARTTSDFAKLAMTTSEVSTKDKGGDLGEVARGELLPELDKAVFNAQAGAILGPIQTKAGWHVLKVEARYPSEIPAFESVKDKLRKDASDETFQRDLKAYLDRLKKEAFIQINEKDVPTT